MASNNHSITYSYKVEEIFWKIYGNMLEVHGDPRRVSGIFILLEQAISIQGTIEEREKGITIFVLQFECETGGELVDVTLFSQITNEHDQPSFIDQIKFVYPGVEDIIDMDEFPMQYDHSSFLDLYLEVEDKHFNLVCTPFLLSKIEESFQDTVILGLDQKKKVAILIETDKQYSNVTNWNIIAKLVNKNRTERIPMTIENLQLKSRDASYSRTIKIDQYVAINDGRLDPWHILQKARIFPITKRLEDSCDN